uniref:Peptidase M16 N-terminal domain-containing protein n=1 Tax=viral metagenome TaxID=1070528 RepID=A0A6C0HIH2_9ZZZZ
MIHTHTFPNGFRIIYEKPRNSIEISAIQVFCKVGSAMETDDMRGVSHFVEHMVFKGTKKMPLSKDISKIYDEIGAYFNASTNKSYTNYIVKCEDEYVKNCIWVLGDMLMNSVFDRAEFEKEKKVVIEETILLEDSGGDIIADMYDASIYKGSSYESPIDTLDFHKPGSLDYAKVLQFYKTFYRPSNMAISIVSHVPFKKFIEILRHSDFTYVLESQPFIRCPNPVISYYPQTEPQYIIKKRKGLNTLHLIIGFRTCSQYSPDKYALNLLGNILGGFMNARLFAILREANGLTYSSYADTSYYSILGDFSISAETDPAKLLVNKGMGAGVLPLLVDIIIDLQKHGVSKSELRIAKSNMKGSMAIEEESNENACFHNGSKTILYDDGTPITSYHDRYANFYKNLTQKDIHDVIKKYFIKSNMTVCILGEHIPSLKTVKSICDKIQ